MRPRILTLVPARMASTRLPGKALLPLHGVPLIDRCLLNTLAIPSSQGTVLATTTAEEDDVLCEAASRRGVDLVRGSEQDVLERLLIAIDRHEPDYVVRITGDCPVASFEIAELLIQDHLRAGADISYPASGFPVGTNSEVYTAAALRRLRSLRTSTDLSEYLIFYFTQNPDVFSANEVRLPPNFHKPWRLTVDEPSDVQLFEALLSGIGAGDRAVAFQEIVEYFERHPDVAQLNGQNKLKYVHDETFLARLRAATRIAAPPR